MPMVPGFEKKKTDDTYWLKKENFAVEIEGITIGKFKAVSGGDIEVDFVEYKNSDENFTRKIPGKTKFTNITLERGFINDKNFLDWMKACVNGNPVRKSGSIIAYNDRGEEKARWNFEEALPAKWVGPNFDADASGEYILEKLELIVEHIVRA